MLLQMTLCETQSTCKVRESEPLWGAYYPENVYKLGVLRLHFVSILIYYLIS